jgi:hypothetical protein
VFREPEPTTRAILPLMSTYLTRGVRLLAFPVLFSLLAGTTAGCIVETRPRHRYYSRPHRECHRNNGPYRRVVCTDRR